MPAEGWRGRLILGAGSVRSRRWGVWVNTLAASSLISRRLRQWMYRRAGVATQAEWIEPGCYFHTTSVSVGPGAKLNRGVYIENVARVTIAPRAGLGHHVVVLTSHHAIGPASERAGEWERRPVVIGEGTWVGARATILGGVTIGPGCVIAAGALVREDCAPNGLYGGVPARRLRELDPS